jgi:hypothetical protein
MITQETQETQALLQAQASFDDFFSSKALFEAGILFSRYYLE